jgi:hypothetical protein
MAEHKCQMLTPGNGLPCKHYLRPENPSDPGFCTQPSRFFCTEAMKHRLPRISYSSLTDFVHCKLRYFHKTVEGLSVKQEHLPEPMKLGRAWDLFIRSQHEEGGEDK